MAEQEKHRQELEHQQRELDDWKGHPTTTMFRKALRVWMRIIQEQWATGAFNGETIEATALANHKAASEFGIIKQILDLDAEAIEGIFENDKDIDQ